MTSLQDTSRKGTVPEVPNHVDDGVGTRIVGRPILRDKPQLDVGIAPAVIG